MSVFKRIEKIKEEHPEIWQEWLNQKEQQKIWDDIKSAVLIEFILKCMVGVKNIKH